MSKNTASLAQAISLMSDVLSHEVEGDLNDTKDIVDNEELYDDLKEQALDFGQEVADDLSDISNELERALDQAESDDDDADDDDAWTPHEDPHEDYNPPADDIVHSMNDDEVDADDSHGADLDTSENDSAVNDDDDKSEPTDDEQLFIAAVMLDKKNVELEKSKEEFTNKIEKLTDIIRASATQIENLNASVDAFVNEVESL